MYFRANWIKVLQSGGYRNPTPGSKKPPPQRRLSHNLACLLLRSFGFRRRLCLAGVGFRVLAAEALDAARSVHQLLFAGEEGVAGGADFHVDGALVGRTGHKGVTARAMHAHFVVSRMDGCLHKTPNSIVAIPDFTGNGATAAITSAEPCSCSKIMSPHNCNETLSPCKDGDHESERVPTGESD